MTAAYDPNEGRPEPSITELPCVLCGGHSEHPTATLCNRCWELETRVTRDPWLARKILSELGGVFELKSNFADVQAFHNKFGLGRDRPAIPALPPDELIRFRLGFLLEELAEHARAAGALTFALRVDSLAVDARYMPIYRERAQLVSAFDGLLDLVVVALGTADFYGFPWEAGWDVVMGRNMAKKRAEPDGSDSKRRSPWDVVKPPGWYGPEAALAQLLTHRTDEGKAT